ncbi:MAG: methyltransferase domain-containing protein [Planctomycetes bacterium]|nr:methyltransferase domain-containing protein [Planctomycetota bacterium]
MKLKAGITFLQESRKDLASVGAILPSSPFLARTIVAHVNSRPDRPISVLEAGGGTGAVTRHLVRTLGPRDKLDIYEINSSFAGHLHKEFVTGAGRMPGWPAVRIYEDSVLNIPQVPRYDYIVSGLPFNSLGEEFAAAVMDRYCKILKPGGSLSFFEYLLIRQITSPFGNKNYRRRCRAVEKVLDGYVRHYQFRRETIFLNIPPAVVRFLRLPGDAAPAAPAPFPGGSGRNGNSGRAHGRR